MDQRSLEWARELANTLRAWIKAEGFKHLSDLAKKGELDISQGVWDGIMGMPSRDPSIAKDTTVYAKIFLRTGIGIADPRKLPPQKLGGALRGQTSGRAWSDDDYRLWLKKSDAKRIAKLVKPSKIKVKNEARSSAVANSDLFAKIISIVKPEVLQSATVQDLLEALVIAIQPVLESSSKEHDRLVEQNRDTLSFLAPALEILMQVPSKREEALRVFLRSRNRS